MDLSSENADTVDAYSQLTDDFYDSIGPEGDFGRRVLLNPTIAPGPWTNSSMSPRGRVIEILVIVDEFTHGSLASLVDHSIIGADATVGCLTGPGWPSAGTMGQWIDRP